MLSNIEYKLLLAFFGFVLLVSAVRTSDFLTLAYNRAIKLTEVEKERVANNVEKIQFSDCNPCGSRPHETIIPFQIVFILIAFGCLILRNPGPLIISTLTLLLILYGYIDWMLTSYEVVIGTEYFNHAEPTFKSYLLINSSSLDFVLLFSITALLIAQSSIIARFTAERFMQD